MEDLAYRRMLDLYYLREQALPQDPAEVARLIRLRGNLAEVEAVLREFFTNNDGDGWIHARCEAEIKRLKAGPRQVLDVDYSQWRKLRAAIFERDGYKCVYCGAASSRLECDHVEPVSLGGSSTLENLVTACVQCNRSKGAKTLDQWRGL